MYQKGHEEIIAEIGNSDFLSIIANETTDVSAKFQLVTVFSYLLKNGKPVESFWAFLNSPKHDDSSLAECIQNALTQMFGENNETLISQSYDGANVTSDKNAGAQALIRLAGYMYTFFIHCYALQFNLLLKKNY